eukprot:466584-Rhodomonas_salina.6
MSGTEVGCVAARRARAVRTSTGRARGTPHQVSLSLPFARSLPPCDVTTLCCDVTFGCCDETCICCDVTVLCCDVTRPSSLSTRTAGKEDEEAGGAHACPLCDVRYEPCGISGTDIGYAAARGGVRARNMLERA